MDDLKDLEKMIYALPDHLFVTTRNKIEDIRFQISSLYDTFDGVDNLGKEELLTRLKFLKVKLRKLESNL